MGKSVTVILILTIVVFFSLAIFIFVEGLYYLPFFGYHLPKQWLVLVVIGVLAIIVLIKNRRKIPDSSTNSKMKPS